MKRRGKLGVGLLIVAAAAGGWYWHTYLRGPQWNVLIVTLDSTRADHLGCYGRAEALTPVIDGLAERGVVFERAYAAAPITSPSHATMFTGLQPVEHGLIVNGHGRLPNDVTTLAELLTERGCRSAAFVGAYPLASRFGLDQGYEFYDEDFSSSARPADVLDRERGGDIVVDHALHWLNEHRTDRFHCWIHLNDPRLPYTSHVVGPGEATAAGTYDGEIAFADRQIGRVLDFLKEQRLDERTLIVVVGDHGQGLGEHQEAGNGYQLYDSTLRVPLVVARPGAGPHGVRVAEPVSLVDLFPTLVEMLGLSPPTAGSGHSLAGVWRGETMSPRDCFAMTDQPLLEHGWSSLRSLTTADWKYIRTPATELYDLRSDPGETTNLAAEQPERVAELEQALAALEAGLHPRDSAVAELAEAQEKALARLAVGGNPADPTAPKPPQLPDVKDKLPLYTRLSEAAKLLESDDPASAEPQLREIVAADPTFLMAQWQLGNCLLKQQKSAEAGEWFQKVLTLDSTNLRAMLNLAFAYTAQQRYPEAIAQYQAAIKADRESPVALLHLGLLQQSLGDLPQAELLFAQSLERDPTYDPAMVAQGDLAMQQGDGDRGAERYIAAIFANRRSLPALVNLGAIAARQNEFDVAERYLRAALEVEPRDALARQYLGRIATHRGRPLETVKAFEEILADTPDHLSTIIALGWLRASSPVDEIRNVEQATALAERAVSLGGRESVDVLDLLAATQAAAGKYDEAVATMVELSKHTAGTPEDMLKQMQVRVDLYARRRPYVSPPAPDPAAKQPEAAGEPKPAWAK